MTDPANVDEYDKAILESVKTKRLTWAIRTVYELAAENRLEDTEGDSALQQIQFEQDVALEKVWLFLLDMMED